MRKLFSIMWAAIFFAGALALLGAKVPSRLPAASLQVAGPAEISSPTYLGFDRNTYPGDAALPLLRQSFSFTGYWLNPPPGETSNTWQGKRAALASDGFGFLVLFNGRLDRALKSASNAKTLGTRDAALAVEAAKKEGFPAATAIFLDQEEGGRMLPEQRAYVYAWADGINTSGYRAGVYCSGMVVKESAGVTITTANDLQDNAEGRKIVFFIYNDSCPPSPGCAFPKSAPPPQQGGIPFATIWQYAQSPRRREYTRSCPAKYDADGNCYVPMFQKPGGIYVDLDSASTPDPSSAGR
jgi:Domain of unknown function (DUF1906)